MKLEIKTPNRIWKANSTSYKKGHLGLMHEKNGMWKGDKVGYCALHDWLSAHYIKEFCEHCYGEENLQWANISQKYKRDITDWMVLCIKCHRKFDQPFIDIKRNKNGTFKKITKINIDNLKGGTKK